MSRPLLSRCVLFWAVILITGSILPIRIKGALHTTANHHFIHPALHGGCFALLVVLGSAFAKTARQRFCGLLAATCFGFTLEILEVFYYHQKLEIRDVRLDAYGALIGYLVFYLLKASVAKLFLSTETLDENFQSVP